MILWVGWAHLVLLLHMALARTTQAAAFSCIQLDWLQAWLDPKVQVLSPGMCLIFHSALCLARTRMSTMASLTCLVLSVW